VEPAQEPRRRAPTLYAIIAIRLTKGCLFIGLALVLYTLSDNDLPREFRGLLHWLRVDPERAFFHELTLKVAKISASKLLYVGAGSLLYSLCSLVEGIGLIFRVSWAGWMAIGESAFFIPIEVYELLHRFSTAVFLILFINIIIVWYLLKNRDRLFRHHSHQG
jgi:uncharacterized membrane protein (DUF2068 family)